MYELIKTVIVSRTYNDLNKLLAKIKRLWVQGDLTEEQYTELNTLAFENDPIKAYDVQKELDRLWVAVRGLESRVTQLETPDTPEPVNPDEPVDPDESVNPDEPVTPDEPDEPVAPEYVQPTGAHDAYQTGDRVSYNGKIYESLINGNVWAPDVYPAGWKEVVEETEE